MSVIELATNDICLVFVQLVERIIDMAHFNVTLAIVTYLFNGNNVVNLLFICIGKPFSSAYSWYVFHFIFTSPYFSQEICPVSVDFVYVWSLYSLWINPVPSVMRSNIPAWCLNIYIICVHLGTEKIVHFLLYVSGMFINIRDKIQTGIMNDLFEELDLSLRHIATSSVWELEWQNDQSEE